MNTDFHSDCFGEVALASQTIGSNTTTAGVIIDTEDYEAMEFFIQSGTVTDGTFTTLLEDGDDPALADASPVDAELVLGSPSFDNTNSDTVKRVGYIGKKRYVLLSLVSTGVTTGGVFSAIAVKTRPNYGPVADQN